uniref:Variant surface glycoprotein 1125.5333 n=1 Tax=Trypanosoma brucei TaxID=5691 RepID=A0A1J0RC39_9TRYP|nr:variant surface glycoprotein 1125.5333 [Trypanosoma brucei]
MKRRSPHIVCGADTPTVTTCGRKIAALLIALLLITDYVASTTAVEKSSASGFKVICQLINLATQDAHASESSQIDDSIESTLALFNLKISAPKALQELTAAEAAAAEIEKEGFAEKVHCAGEAKERCVKAATRAKDHGKSKEQQSLEKAAAHPQILEAINATLMPIDTAVRELKAEKRSAQPMEVNKLLLQALGTKPDGVSELKPTKWSSDRATSCGKPNADTAGTVVGDNLATDIVCLCSSDASNTDNKACGTKAAGPTVQFSGTGNELKYARKTLAGECKTQFPAQPLTASNLQDAIRHFEIEVARPQGTDDVLTNTLGFIKGAGSTG